ncbi:hypothetical protein [Pontibacter roseus]|uniref:hypothetical protein n=1 Tax=Pontibacter roseus TaxID=336989 RepID=UPI000361ECCC|nr:hypothetical protein [Pontibacter roseus]
MLDYKKLYEEFQSRLSKLTVEELDNWVKKDRVRIFQEQIQEEGKLSGSLLSEYLTSPYVEIPEDLSSDFLAGEINYAMAA